MRTLWARRVRRQRGLFRLPPPRELLRLSDLIGRHLGDHLVALLDHETICLNQGRQVKPHVSEYVPASPLTPLVHHTEVVLCSYVTCSALLRYPSAPDVVLHCIVCDGDVKLRFGVALLS